MRHTFGTLLLLGGILLTSTASAQQLAGKEVTVAPVQPTGPRPSLIGTGLTGPGVMMYDGPVAGQLRSPGLSQVAPVADAGEPIVVNAPSSMIVTAPSSSANPLSCIQLTARVEADITKAPSEVLPIVRRALIDNDACSCDIVKMAIKTAKADDKLTGLIVETAVTTQPARYKEIVECAVMAKPTAKEQIRAALTRVFGTKGNGKSGKIVVARITPTLPGYIIREIPQMYFPPFTSSIPSGTPSNPDRR